MQNNDEALLSINLASHGQFVKLFTTIDPHGVKRKRELDALLFLSYGCHLTVNVL